MLGVQDLQPVRCAVILIRGYDGEGDQHLLVVGAEQVLGGGVIEAPSKESKDQTHAAIIECWGVTDLTEGHWMALARPGGAVFYAVPPEVAIAMRATMERFHADGVRRIASEADRRRGVLDAVGALAATFQQSTLTAAAAAGRAQGGARGPQG